MPALLALSSAATPRSPRSFLVHGHRLTAGLPPILGVEAEGEEGEGSQRERLARWIASRHRAAPGYDWHAIDSANLLASLDRAAAAAQARGPQPVWHERGPNNLTGSTAVTALRPDGKTLLVVTSQGGVFSGAPAPGVKAWARATDSLGGYLQGFLVSSPPETWIAAVSEIYDGRVYVSRNRGGAWSVPKGLPPLVDVYELVQDGGNRRIVYLLAEVRQGRDLLPILARSQDGGLSFAVVWTGSSYERPGLWTSRTGAGPLYLLSHGQLFASTDHGSSFSPLGAAAGSRTNIGILRGSEAGGPTLYAAVGSSYLPTDLAVSEDGGHTWENRYRFPAVYPLDFLFGGAMAASTRDPDLVLFGNQDGWRSTDGGRNFQRINDWPEYYGDPAGRLHADINGLQFVVYRGQEILLLSTDGGTYLSTDGGANVRNVTLSGLPNAQLYSTWSSAASPDLFLVGAQDQGFQKSAPARGARAGAPLGTAQLISGDYSGLTSASHDLTNVFAMYPTSQLAAGALVLFGAGGDPSSLVSASLPAMSSAGFFVASAADPDDPAAVYVAGDHIWRIHYEGSQRFMQTELPQSFSPDGTDYVSALAIAPADHGIWYAGTYEGHLWYSRDHGATWTESATTGEQLPYASNSTLAVSSSDPLTCFAGGSGYGTAPVLVTHDGGVHWDPLSNGLPSTVVWSLAFDGTPAPATQVLYAATEAGPYVLDAASSTWRSLHGGGAPTGRYFSVEGVPAAHLVRFATWGRGVWDYVPPPRGH
jgi:hypothetical protein